MASRFAVGLLALLALCVLYTAECQVSTPCICTLEFAPVCVKGKTYGNACQARCDGYKEGDWTVGACAKSPAPSPKPCICTKEYRPVCYEGKTYGNPCMAKCDGVTKWIDGECGKGKKCGCPKIKAPVCAKGRTFANSCVAKCFGYLTYTKGACKPIPIRRDCICPAIYAPVCVQSVGKTFSNACSAECSGFRKYTPGICEPPPIKCDAGSAVAKCSGDVCTASDSPCAKNPAVACIINPCSSTTYLGTKLKGQQCKPIYVHKTLVQVEKNCNKPLPPLVCAPGSPTARCKGDPCKLTTSPCKGNARYVCLGNSCGKLTYLGTKLTNAMCTAIFVDPLTRTVAKECIVK